MHLLGQFLPLGRWQIVCLARDNRRFKMTRPTFASAAGIGVVIALGFMGFGCSSSSPSTGTGGKTGTAGATGTGGTAAGTGGKTGTGGNGSGGNGADAGPALPMCANPAPADKSACNSDPSC